MLAMRKISVVHIASVSECPEEGSRNRQRAENASEVTVGPFALKVSQ